MYRLEGRDIVVDGWEDGIGDDPYSGLYDLKSVNTISVPGEASVNFATVSKTPPTLSGTVTSANTTTEVCTFTGATGLESGMAISFSATTLGGVSINTVYWVDNVTASTFVLYTTVERTLASKVNITASGTGTFATYNMTTPKFIVQDPVVDGYNPELNYSYYLQDDIGQIWTNRFETASKYWVFTGNVTTTGGATGTGLIVFTDANLNRWLFSFRTSYVDYVKLVGTPGPFTWVYGWRPSNGSSGNTFQFNNASKPHYAYIAQNNHAYYCDGNYLGEWFQTDPTVNFDPTNTATYTWDGKTLLMPTTETALCIGELGDNLLIGGSRNAAYPWDKLSVSYSFPILIAETRIQRIETINTTAYLFAGNRGRIYQTNGYNASLYKKVPDHLSDTVEPYFEWGGSVSLKNQLYFGVRAKTNAGVVIPNYGGLWAIDVDTSGLRMVSKLSYDTYDGYASALFQAYPYVTGSVVTDSTGSSVITGWYDGVSKGGLDTGSSSPYTGGQSLVESDMIPVGTFLTKRTFEQLEFKLSKPLVAGESVALYYRTSIGATPILVPLTEGGATGDLSGWGIVNFENVQWVSLRAVLTSTASSPSYTRLKEIRLR